MKKLFAFLFVLIFAISLNAQNIFVAYEDTVANSQKETFYYQIPSSNLFKVDSIKIQIVATGEIDLDRVITTLGALKYSNGHVAGKLSSAFVAVATADTTTLTIDNAASTTTAVLERADIVALNSTALSGYDALKVVVEAGSSGNDATDPNKLVVKFFEYRTKTQ